MKIKHLSILCFLAGAVSVHAQTVNYTVTKEGNVDEVVLTGTRNKKRTVTNTPVPVDVIDIKQLSQKTGLHEN
ncbi:hypothetical protein [uncultured Chryseobacterium sp.]|uniref:hypothetical protein n=1 Tax=uncultured Chryseobacterium sp. TaxID=259322 RepID=UPI002615911A|nr:hypothetical protein [uncultured Chryseobacterium sp.]